MQSPLPSREEISTRQLVRLQALVATVLESNPFYQRKLGQCGVTAPPGSLAEFSRTRLFTTKHELVQDQAAHPLWGTNLSFPLERYIRFHQTSGTTGLPLRWLDTAESWTAMVESWKEVYFAAAVKPSDRVFFAFSFGPFIGFWLAFEAAAQIGCLCLPGGGLSSAARVRMLLENEITVLCCTPTYAIRLAEVAASEKLDLSKSRVRRLIVAGEPGGSIPATRKRLETLWPGAAVCDHHGMTETGPVSFQCSAQPCVLHVVEEAFYPEIIDPITRDPAAPGKEGELVLTNLTRTGSPLLRYRTGDIVKSLPPSEHCRCGRADLTLAGGVLGRTDDMVTIRGVNVYPSALERVIRQFEDLAEYQVQVAMTGTLPELVVRIEASPACSNGEELRRQIEKALALALNLRIEVVLMPADALPRFELKARRWIRSITRQP